MAAVVNARDVLLQAAATRLDPVPITIGDVTGLAEALKGVRITASATSFFGTSGTTSPATITLTAERVGGVVGPVVWSVISGSGTVSPSGDTCVVTGSTVTGQSITLRARVTDGAINYDAQIVLTKLGTLAGQGAVNLATQITGQLANGNVSGLGALALLGSVSLTNPVQVVGDLAANRIGVGTLAAGVIYAGTVNVNQLTGVLIAGKSIAGGNYLLLGTASSTTAPVSFFLNTDSVPANGAIGRITGSFTVSPLSGNHSLVVDASSARMFAGATGLVSLSSTRSGGGTNSVEVSQSAGVRLSGSTVISGNDVDVTASTLTLTGYSTLNITGATSFSGSLGSRIILKGVTYNAEVNGAPGTTVKFL